MDKFLSIFSAVLQIGNLLMQIIPSLVLTVEGVLGGSGNGTLKKELVMGMVNQGIKESLPLQQNNISPSIIESLASVMIDKTVAAMNASGKFTVSSS